MSEKKTRKLRLNRETVRVLNDAELRLANGAAGLFIIPGASTANLAGIVTVVNCWDEAFTAASCY